MAAMFKQMDPSPRVQRVKGFTSETANVLHGTLNRIFYLIELMPNKNFMYGLPRKFSRDRTEGQARVMASVQRW